MIDINHSDVMKVLCLLIFGLVSLKECKCTVQSSCEDHDTIEINFQNVDDLKVQLHSDKVQNFLRKQLQSAEPGFTDQSCPNPEVAHSPTVVSQITTTKSGTQTDLGDNTPDSCSNGDEIEISFRNVDELKAQLYSDDVQKFLRKHLQNADGGSSVIQSYFTSPGWDTITNPTGGTSDGNDVATTEQLSTTVVTKYSAASTNESHATTAKPTSSAKTTTDSPGTTDVNDATTRQMSASEATTDSEGTTNGIDIATAEQISTAKVTKGSTEVTKEGYAATAKPTSTPETTTDSQGTADEDYATTRRISTTEATTSFTEVFTSSTQEGDLSTTQSKTSTEAKRSPAGTKERNNVTTARPTSTSEAATDSTIGVSYGSILQSQHPKSTVAISTGAIDGRNVTTAQARSTSEVTSASTSTTDGEEVLTTQPTSTDDVNVGSTVPHPKRQNSTTHEDDVATTAQPITTTEATSSSAGTTHANDAATTTQPVTTTEAASPSADSTTKEKVSTVSPTCPPPVSNETCKVIYDGKCFTWITPGLQDITLAKANTLCLDEGFQLGNIYDDCHYELIIDKFEHETTLSNSVWTGMTLDIESGKFDAARSSAGEDVTISTDWWYPDYPKTDRGRHLFLQVSKFHSKRGIANSADSNIEGAFCEA